MIIRNSAKAIIIRDNQLLVTKMEDDGVFYLLPGGGQEPGEKLDMTVRRECVEETGYDVIPKDIIFIREGFEDKNIHRVEFMFLCEIINKVSNECIQYDEKQCGIEWIGLENLQELPLYPKELRNHIYQLVRNQNNQIYLGEIR